MTNSNDMQAHDTLAPQLRERIAALERESQIDDKQIQALQIALNRMTQLVDQWSEIATDRQTAIEKYKAERDTARAEIESLKQKVADYHAWGLKARAEAADLRARLEYSRAMSKLWKGWCKAYRTQYNVWHDAAIELETQVAALHPLADMAAGLLAEKGAVQKLSAIRGIVNAQIEFSGKRLMDDVRHLHYSQAMIAVLKLIDMNGIPELLTKDAALDKLSDVLSEVSKNITDQPDDTQLMDNIEPGLLPEEEIYEDCDKRILKIVGDYFSLSWNKWEKIYGDVNLITALRESGCVKTIKNSQPDNLGA